MTLIEEFQKVLERLNKGGWSSIFMSMDIDLTKGKLRESLLRPIDEALSEESGTTKLSLMIESLKLQVYAIRRAPLTGLP